MGPKVVPNRTKVNNYYLLQVVGISSSFHIARLQCGLAEPYRFAQASSLKVNYYLHGFDTKEKKVKTT